jgi:tellurite resistance protein
MIINLNNYEEYFLLYIDNELSKQDRNEVASFLQSHPELQEEFDSLQFTFNTPEEEISLSDKSFLLKNEPSTFINESNYEEHLVAYHDNELNEEEKQEVKQFISQNSRHRTDFELVGKSKLVADETIVFPDKRLLFKKGRVVPMMMWRALAAAVFAGFGLWFFISYSNRKIEIPQVAIENKVNQTNTPFDSPHVEKNIVLQQEKPSPNPSPFPEKNTTVQKDSPKKVEINSSTNPILKEEKKEVLVKNEKIPLPKETIQLKNENNLPENTTKEIAATTPALEPTSIIAPNTENLKNTNSSKENITAQNAKPASFIINEKQKSEDYIFYNTPSEEFARTKVGGFLKKMKRTIIRGNPITQLFAGDDKQVASN